MSAQYTAFLDANVLYPVPLRDILMELSVSDIFQARWSNIVLEEMKRSILRNNKKTTSEKLDYTIERMNSNLRDSCVEEVPLDLIEMVKNDLPDEDDAHVIAGAIVSRSHAIVTWNLKHFPQHILAKYRIEVIDPDSFLVAQIDLDIGRFLKCIATIRKRLKKPPYTVDEYFNSLIKNRLVKTATILRQFETAI